MGRDGENEEVGGEGNVTDGKVRRNSGLKQTRMHGQTWSDGTVWQGQIQGDLM